ncbi:histidine phosphatase family protein [Rubellimicrobium arenae]|uniref:histidine phosphatase family protein n=1 Tax=Rubellimicrobium arenae TaxID=2817372 RepID=UPI001B303F0F|nr:histidine phosphatase family protein [Rubellimicrobium arenae]
MYPNESRSHRGFPISVQLYLIRHATHADFGRRLTGRAAGVPLTPEGERQAAALARGLAGEALTQIHTSPRDRARATAEALARASGAPVTVVEALDEVDFGDWTGSEFADLHGQPLWDDWNTRRATARAPGGESMGEAADRAVRHMESLAPHGGERIALVSHCDVIRALVARVLGLSLDHLLRFEIGPASVSRLEAGTWGARVLSLNETIGMDA